MSIEISVFEKNDDIFYDTNYTFILNKLINLIRNKRSSENFEEIITPTLVHSNEWKKSGHLNFFKENMYFFKEIGLKPMNCPGAANYVKKTIRYSSNKRKIFELGRVFRKESSGSRFPLKRMNLFYQDDIHIFCKNEEDIYNSVNETLKDWKNLYTNILNLPFCIKLSTRPANFIGNIDDWNKAEDILANLLKENGFDLEKDEGEGAFYGPKLDLLIKLNNSELQLSTVQLDFQLSKNFNLPYSAVIHTALFGSLQRFLYVLKETEIPIWCSKDPLIFISLLDNNYSKNIFNKIRKIDSKAKYFNSDNNLQNILKQNKSNMIFFCGNNEYKNNTISLRKKVKNKFEKKIVDISYIDDLLKKQIFINEFFCYDGIDKL